MKKELLAPAGDFDSLKAAINNGADAVYLAGKSFGARKFAKNFSNDELIEAVKYAHLYGVKVYVTVNTIIYETEINDCLKYIEFLYNIGIDAVIVQDIGLICLIRKYFPDLEIHASTQAHTHNLEQIKVLENLGVKRVVLAREMSIDEINNLDTNMELEIFVHGALCISYSGECLFSSGVLGRSGNRGECAGLCRCPYNLIENNNTIIKDKYLLSPKEFNTTDYVEELKKSKAYSFKIEGRMKSPEYVGYVTGIYRKLLDKDNYKLSSEEIFNLKSLYNRGFTKGYLFNTSDKDFISIDSSNHLGVEIGDVIGFTKDKIKIKLTHKLSQEDAVRLPNNKGMYINFLYNDKMLLVNKANAGDIIYIDNKVCLKELGKVNLTINKTLVTDILNKELKKINVDIYVKANKNSNLIIKYNDAKNEVQYVGDIVSVAKTSPISRDRIKEILTKLGNTPFKSQNINIDMDEDIFIPVGVLNEIRRNLISELINKRTCVNRHTNLILDKSKIEKKNKNIKISAKANNEEQIKCLLDLNVDYIYVTNKELYNKYKMDRVYLVLDRVISKHEDYQDDNLLIGEIGSLKYTFTNKVKSDYCLNVVNHYYLDFLEENNVQSATISPELTMDLIESLLNNYSGNMDIECIIYGTIEYMIMKYNFIKNMNLNGKNIYYLEDKSKRKFRIFRDNYTHLKSEKKINLIDKLNGLKASGVSIFRLELFEENTLEITELINLIRNNIY